MIFLFICLMLLLNSCSEPLERRNEDLNYIEIDTPDDYIKYCSNGATNPPTCDIFDPCNNEAKNPPKCNVFDPCTNEAINPPDCNSYYPCSNGAKNPPTCNIFDPCTNGAINPPECDVFMPCANGAKNPPACDTFEARSVLVFTLSNQCPNGYEKNGFGGFILSKNYSCPYNPGAPYNSGWNWCHPSVCTNNVDVKSTSESIVFINNSLSCPTGYNNLGVGGFLLHKNYTCSYGAGAAYNSDWNWCHPKICSAASSNGTIRGSIAFVGQNTNCPSGYVSKGIAGFILHKNYVCPYGIGGVYNTEWNWCHPKICEKP